MDGRAALDRGGVKLVDHLAPRHLRLGQRLEPALVVAIDHHAGGQRPQIGMLAAGDDEAELRMQPLRGGATRRARAIALAGAEGGLVVGGAQLPARLAIALRIFLQAAFGDPAAELVRISK